MLIDGLIEAARERLVDNAKLIDVAKLLSAGTDLVIVCDSDGVLTGVVTKTDLVKQTSTCHNAVCMLPVATVMTRDVALCRESDSLADMSEPMNRRHLKNIPVMDINDCPLGVLTARIILRALLGEAKYEESRLINYVDGVRLTMNDTKFIQINIRRKS